MLKHRQQSLLDAKRSDLYRKSCLALHFEPDHKIASLQVHLISLLWRQSTYRTLELSNVQTLEDIASLVRVTDILKSLSSILSTFIHQDFLSTRVLINELCDIVN